MLKLLRSLMKPRLDPDSLRIKCNAEITLRGPDGRIKARRRVHNLVVTAGKDAILQTAAPAYIKAFNYLGIGTGAVAPSASDTTLGAEVARSASGITPSFASHQLTFSETFAAGTGTGAITEAGLFSANSSGTMFNRLTFSVINKGAADSLTVSIVLS